MVRDPVCGREVEDKNVNEQSDYKGRTYYFCSNTCKIKFDNDPGKYEVKIIIMKRRR
jgi:YHS domain-containing protein